MEDPYDTSFLAPAFDPLAAMLWQQEQGFTSSSHANELANSLINDFTRQTLPFEIDDSVDLMGYQVPSEADVPHFLFDPMLSRSSSSELSLPPMPVNDLDPSNLPSQADVMPSMQSIPGSLKDQNSSFLPYIQADIPYTATGLGTDSWYNLGHGQDIEQLDCNGGGRSIFPQTFDLLQQNLDPRCGLESCRYPQQPLPFTHSAPLNDAWFDDSTPGLDPSIGYIKQEPALAGDDILIRGIFNKPGYINHSAFNLGEVSAYQNPGTQEPGTTTLSGSSTAKNNLYDCRSQISRAVKLHDDGMQTREMDRGHANMKAKAKPLPHSVTRRPSRPRPVRLKGQLNSRFSSGLYPSVGINKFTMGQEASQLQASDDLKRHDIRIARRPSHIETSRSDGWTPVNGQLSRNQPNEEINDKKRKRTPKFNGNTVSDGSGPPSQPKNQDGGSVAGENGLSEHVEKHTLDLKPVIGQLKEGQKHDAIESRNGKAKGAESKRKSGRQDKGDSESDVDDDAFGFLQRVAAAESDDDDHAGAQGKHRHIRPLGSGTQPVWRASQQPIGTHYTIYSPHVQPQGYAQPRPPPETFDPSAPLSAQEEAQLKDEGRFTKMEQSFLRDAVDEYCKKHGISVELANDYVCGKAREGNIPSDFWDEVCRALPQRTKNSIQRAAKRVFRNHQKKGPWTAQEEAALAAAYHQAPDQWAKICEEVPGRSAEQCRDRWRNYTQNGSQLTRGPWTDTEEAQFVDICKSMLNQARLDRESLRRQGRVVSEKFDPIDHLNFTAISTMMQGRRSRLHCRNKWHKLKKRPDVEAAIEAVMKGTPLPLAERQGDQEGQEHPAASSPPQAGAQPSSETSLPPASAGATQTSQLPANPEDIASLLPPKVRSYTTPNAVPHILPPPTTSTLHDFRPSPLPTFNGSQGCISAPSQSLPDPRRPEDITFRVRDHSTHPNPEPSNGATSKVARFPATDLGGHGNRPPGAYPLLPTVSILPSPASSSSLLRPTPGPKRVLTDPGYIGFGSMYPNSQKNGQQNGNPTSLGTFPTAALLTSQEGLPRLPPINGSTVSRESYLKPSSPIVAALAKSAPPTTGLPPPAMPTPVFQLNGRDARSSTTPESADSRASSQDLNDGRPSRKKIKIAKAQEQNAC